jgi:hypothetical protein
MSRNRITISFTLQTLFVLMAFLGLGLTAMKYPSGWGWSSVNLAVLVLASYGVASALATDGDRRLQWAAFSTILIIGQNGMTHIVPTSILNAAAFAFHNESLDDFDARYPFGMIIYAMANMATAAICALIIPWLVKMKSR